MLEIITDGKSILFKRGDRSTRKAVNSIDYNIVGATVIFIYNGKNETVDSETLQNLRLNGETLTPDNADAKLKEALFFLDDGLTPDVEEALDGKQDKLPDGNGDQYLYNSAGRPIWQSGMTQTMLDTGTSNGSRTISPKLLKDNLNLKQDILPVGSGGQFLYNSNGYPVWTGGLTQSSIDNASSSARIVSGQLLKSNLDLKQDKLPDGTNDYFLRWQSTTPAWTIPMNQNYIDTSNTASRTISGSLLKDNLDLKQDKLPDGASRRFLAMSNNTPVWWAELSQSGIDSSDSIPRTISGLLLKANLDLKQNKLPVINTNYSLRYVNGDYVATAYMTQSHIDSSDVTPRAINGSLLKSTLDLKQDALPTPTSAGQFLYYSGASISWQGQLTQSQIDSGSGSPRVITGALLKANLDLKANKSDLPILISQSDFDNLSEEEKLNNSYDVYIQ